MVFSAKVLHLVSSEWGWCSRCEVNVFSINKLLQQINGSAAFRVYTRHINCWTWHQPTTYISSSMIQTALGRWVSPLERTGGGAGSWWQVESHLSGRGAGQAGLSHNQNMPLVWMLRRDQTHSHGCEGSTLHHLPAGPLQPTAHRGGEHHGLSQE